MSLGTVLSRRGLLACCLGLVCVGVALPSSTSAAEKKRVHYSDLITFTWTLAPEDPFSKENAVGAMPKAFKRGETFFLTITGTPKEGYHTYPLTKRTKEQSGGVSQIKYADNNSFQPLWPVIESEPELVDEGPGNGLNLEQEKAFTWTQEILVKPDATPGEAKLQVQITGQVCDIHHCVPGSAELTIPITILEGPLVPLTPTLQARMKIAEPPPEVVTKLGKPKVHPTPPKDVGLLTPPKPPRHNASEMSIFQFVSTGIWFGLLSLVTPCVFPMIPITVSFFLKQSEKKHNSPLLLATVYSGTIITVLTVGGVLLSTLLVLVIQHWATNLVLGLLFLVFAFSLFGMYEIMLPSGLINRTASGERLGGLAGTFFMALTFTLISFACVAPFYGSFLAFVASASSANDWFKLVLGSLAYSTTFAAPFFILALFPTLLRTLPRSGSWMNTIKVVMGFVEVAAAVKFLRSAELAYSKTSTFLTFDLSLGIYLALCLLCGLYLLNIYRLPHDYEPLERIGVPRVLCALVFLTLGCYLAPGLFKQPDGESQKPAGTVYAWIEAFLLPDEAPAVTAVSGQQAAMSELVWSGELRPSLATAATEGKLVFVDFTGIICPNCRYNEKTVFKQPEIRELFKQYVLVKLYTDGIPRGFEPADPAEQNKQLLNKVFESTQLPLYVIFKPSGDSYEVVDIYDEGKINSPEKFADFLKRQLPAK